MLINYAERSNLFYSSYPNQYCLEEHINSCDNVLGSFQNLQQVVGIGFQKMNKEIVAMFDLHNVEEVELLCTYIVNTPFNKVYMLY